MSAPDVVFPVRRGEDNEELRYALRSLSNIPHGQVWIAGYAPRWVQGCRAIPTQQNRTKHENSLKNLLAACQQPDLSEEFYLWNDDIFLLRPAGEVPLLHRGTMAEFGRQHAHLGESMYMRGAQVTTDILALLGVEDPLCYELHVPMPMPKELVPEIVAQARAGGMPRTTALHVRSLIGNLGWARLGRPGEWAADVKVADATVPWEPDPAVEYVSTSDFAWGNGHPAVDYIRKLYPEPGPYEEPGPKLTIAKGARLGSQRR